MGEVELNPVIYSQKWTRSGRPSRLLDAQHSPAALTTRRQC